MNLTFAGTGYPHASVPSRTGGVPTEVTLISQLSFGAGDALIQNSQMRQAHHQNYIDALDEPSTCIGATRSDLNDHSALYTFSVGAGGHPFHRHSGARCFTAISGSAGASLRFVSIDDQDLAGGGFAAFVSHLHIVEIPPDCLFVVRFGPNVWHQFAPIGRQKLHPALFAISYHRDEREGLSADSTLHRQVESIAKLTETLPAEILTQLVHFDFNRKDTARTALCMHMPWQNTLVQCSRLRGWFGRVRARTQALFGKAAYRLENAGQHAIRKAPLREDSLLRAQFAHTHVEDDNFVLRINKSDVKNLNAKALLALALDGFVKRPPIGVTRLMLFRNALVKPLGLRTATLGCPVSSLLQKDAAQQFAGYAVHQTHVSADGNQASVLLGADDKHLQFRSVVQVTDLNDAFEVSLATRVHTLNAFGWIYMRLIKRTHQRFVAPAMLGLACGYAVQNQRSASNPQFALNVEVNV